MCQNWICCQGQALEGFIPGCHLPLKQRAFLPVGPLTRGHSPRIRAHQLRSAPTPRPQTFLGLSPQPWRWLLASVIIPPDPPPHLSRSRQKGLSTSKSGGVILPLSVLQWPPLPWNKISAPTHSPPCLLSSCGSSPNAHPGHRQPFPEAPEILPPSRPLSCFFLCSWQRRLLLILLIQPDCHLFKEAFPDCTMLPLLLFTSSCFVASWYRSQPVIILASLLTYLLSVFPHDGQLHEGQEDAGLAAVLSPEISRPWDKPIPLLRITAGPGSLSVCGLTSPRPLSTASR